MTGCVFSLQATAEANNLAAVATAKDTYNKRMEEVSQDFCTTKEPRLPGHSEDCWDYLGGQEFGGGGANA